MSSGTHCRHNVRLIAAFVVLGAASACGGAPNTPNGPVVGSPGGGGPPPLKLVDVKVTVTIPAAGSGVRSDYLSPNTQSLAIQLAAVNGQGVTGVNPTIMNTLPKSRDCKTQNQGVVCSATAKGSPGKDTFEVTTYDNVDATGSVLSVGTVQATIASAGGSLGITNRVPLTLDGIIASLKLALKPNKAKRGVRTTAAVSVDAYDASGAEIVGLSDYSEPIALAIQGDSNKSFLLHEGGRSGQSLTIRKPSSDITLSYDGNKQASPVSVDATVSGPSGPSKSAGFDLTGKQPPPPVGTIYVLNVGATYGQAATVTEYSGKAKGNAAPERTLSLDKKLYAVSIAVDSSGNLYVGYFDSHYGQSGGNPDTGNEIAMYAPGASGNDPPTVLLQADPSGSSATTLYPVFIAFDPSGRLVTYGATAVDSNSGGDAVLTYAAGSSGAAPPEYGFNFQSPNLYYPGPSGLAIDAANNFYVNGGLKQGFTTDYGLYVAAAADIGNSQAQPLRTISWNSTSKLAPGSTTDVALNKSGEIFIGNFVKNGSGSSQVCQAAVNVYAAGAGGGSKGDAPLRTLSLEGVATQGSDCASSRNPLVGFFPEIQVYGTALFAVDDFNNAVDEFPGDAHGTVKPILHIAGSATQLDAPIAIVVTSISGPAQAGPVTGARAGTQSFKAPASS